VIMNQCNCLQYSETYLLTTGEVSKKEKKQRRKQNKTLMSIGAKLNTSSVILRPSYLRIQNRTST